MAKTAEEALAELVPYAPASAANKEDYIKLVNQQILGKDKNGQPRPISDLIYFLQVSQTTGLNPLSKQVYAVYRWDNRVGREVMVIQTGIDGLRSIAEKSGAYGGSDDGVVKMQENGELPEMVSVTVYKINPVNGARMGTTATARWSEYYPKDLPATARKFWDSMPISQLEKCAEAKALRKAFPNTAQLYVTEEMEQAIPVTPTGEALPSVMDEIKSAQTPEQLNAIMQRMGVEDRKRSVDLIADRLEEITK